VKELKSIVEQANNFCDLWILSRLANVINLANKYIDNFQFSDAALSIHAFWLYELCDIYLVC
jgi:valyl-tRNA synthetase